MLATTSREIRRTLDSELTDKKEETESLPKFYIQYLMAPPSQAMAAPSTTTNSDQPPYIAIAVEAQKQRDHSIPKEYLLPEDKVQHYLKTRKDLRTVPRDSDHFTEHELSIIDAGAGQILKNVRERKWTSVEVTDAFCKSAAVAQQLVC